MMERRWIVGVFGLALAARLGFLFVADQPLLYTHQYTYFTSALQLAERPDTLAFIIKSDEWRTWDKHWTIAPLYFIFLAGLFELLGPHLVPILILQCVLDSVVAVLVALLGQRLAGPRGFWAGVSYAVYWPAVEMPSWTMTENLHTVLLVASIVLLTTDAAQPSRRRLLLGGLLLGLSALARAVSSAFLGLATLWRWWLSGVRRGWIPASFLAAAGAAMILPWTARNVFIIGEPILIESAAFENIWWANHLGDRQRYLRQAEIIDKQPTAAAKRAAALRFALRGIQKNPAGFADRVRGASWHFLRPEGLQNLLRIERSLEPWRHFGTIVFDDLLLIAMVPLFVVFLFAGRPSPTRGLVLAWCVYYLFMIIVVFHNEIRYRSAFVPLGFAGAAGGLSVLLDRESRRRILVWLSLALGLWLTYAMVSPFVPLAWRSVAASRALRPALAAVERGEESRAVVESVAATNPGSARPWLTYGRKLALAGRAAEAVAAYELGAKKSSPANWASRLALPRLLSDAGRADDAARALHVAHALSWNNDPWLALEVAWRELPPPRTNEILVGAGDYGAVRGFFHPRGFDPELSAKRREWTRYEWGTVLPPPGAHRWSRHRAWLRLIPTEEAPAYDVTLHMGVPFPSTLLSPVVRVRVAGNAPVSFTLTDEVRPYGFRATVPAGEPLVVRLDAPTWCRSGEPADQGVRVDRMTVSPASTTAPSPAPPSR